MELLDIPLNRRSWTWLGMLEEKTRTKSFMYAVLRHFMKLTYQLLCSCHCKKCAGRVLCQHRTLLIHATRYGMMSTKNEMTLDSGSPRLQFGSPGLRTSSNLEFTDRDEEIETPMTPFAIEGTETEVVHETLLIDDSSMPMIEAFDLDVTLFSLHPDTGEHSLEDFTPELASETSSVASLHVNSISLIPDDSPNGLCQGEVCNSGEHLKPRLDESDSDLQSSDTEDEISKNSFKLKLRAFAQEARVSRRHMNALMCLLRDVGLSWFPLDYRTLLNECSVIDATMSIAAPFAQPADAIVILVCGHCWLSYFDAGMISAAVTCTKCDVSTVRCPRPLCYSRCVLTSQLRGRSMNSLVYCTSCGIGSDSTVARRTFRFPLSRYVQKAFSNHQFAFDAMAPFHGFCELMRHSPDMPCQLHCVQDWYAQWIQSFDRKTFSSEIWDGKLFRDNPIWRAHGPRSLLLIISLDWFPPFKQRDYSVGILTVAPANLTSQNRAKRLNTWILAVIEGPDEPGHVIECIRPCFDEMRLLGDVGVEVFDVVTMKHIRIHVSCPLVSADVPACAKLGNLYGHSSYFPCVSCEYQGVVCGCKPTKRNGKLPARWDNRAFRPGSTGQRLLLSGHAERTLNKGEHISFVDTQVLLPFHLRKESVHVQGAKIVTDALDRDTNQASIDRDRKRARSNGPSALSILDPQQFQFTTGFAIEGMHTILKGVVLRLWKATVADKYKKQWYNVNYYEGGLHTLKRRLAKFKFPIGSPTANKFVARRHSLKAEELYTVLRICGPIVFNNIVPKSVVQVWSLFSHLFTNLLHYHISKPWMNSESGLRHLVNEAFVKYHAVFGACHMPSNFHKTLHCWLDFYHWGPLRSHWAFPYERMYGALSATSRMQNRSQVTMSIVNNIHLIYVTSTDSEVDVAGRILQAPPNFVDVQDLDVVTFSNAGYVWVKSFNLAHSRRWHIGECLVSLSAGASLNSDCFFIIVAFLCPPRRNYSTLSVRKPENLDSFFVLRQLCPLKSRTIFEDSATFYSMKLDTFKSNDHMGKQVLFSTSSLLSSTNAISAVVQYIVDPHQVLFIPLFGIVDFS